MRQALKEDTTLMDDLHGPRDAARRLRLLTAREVAGALRLSVSTVYKLSRLGQLPSIAVTNGARRCRRRWREADVRRYLDRRSDGGLNAASSE